ncbi:unnamed protein product [Pedinophyceae sp. YPF-701]|nr:unnamed protein product [Pedinophyceae sp. YPF-701]
MRGKSNGGGASQLGFLFGDDEGPAPQGNNHQRVDGQNNGNFISDRPSSRVIAPPGGRGDNNIFGRGEEPLQELKRMTPRDLRVELRSRGLNPAGCKDSMVERLANNYDLPKSNADCEAAAAAASGLAMPGESAINGPGNNYARPNGQNVGNFVTDRPSSRVLAPPGGGSSLNLFA